MHYLIQFKVSLDKICFYYQQGWVTWPKTYQDENVLIS